MIEIRKHSGESEEFDEAKLAGSMERAEVPKDLVLKILHEIKPLLKTGLSTDDLFVIIKDHLKHYSKKLEAHYSIDRAIHDLGPDGYTFERYIAKIFQHLGYQTKVGQTLMGKCITHEVDVIAQKEETLYIECKFHKSAHTKNNAQKVLYLNSRYIDLKENPNNQFDHFLLASNTRFTSDAIQYAECVGLKLLGRNYPFKNALSDIVRRSKLFPVTSLSLKIEEKEFFFKSGVILCKELVEFEKFNMSASRIKELMDEARDILS